MSDIQDFTPEYGQAVKISATATTGSAELGVGNVVRVANFGADHVFVRVGTSSVEATVDVDLVILNGGTVYLRTPGGSGQYLAAVCDSGDTATVYAITGYADR